ncbi:MAG TPA: Rrf2 family transcriptional regulator [Acidimicrobiia bacterium]|nr:Rrf2 family transcriptional regulator [Acidimicrobiia bacterium]
MKLSEGVEWGVHCGALLAVLPPGVALPAGRLAEFHGVPTAYLAKHLQAMSRAGLVESVPGPRGGYRLARPAAEISILDVVEAIDGRAPAFRCTEIRQRGPAARPGREYRLPCAIHAAMNRADAAWREELRATSLADIVAAIARDASPKGIEQGITWLMEVTS